MDALTATSRATAEAAAARFPGDYRVLPIGVDLDLFAPSRPTLALRRRVEARGAAAPACGLPRARRPSGLGARRPADEAARRPALRPRALRGRVLVRTAVDARTRALELSGAAGLVRAARASARLSVEAQAAAVPLVDPPGSQDQPELVAAAMARLAEDESWRARCSAEARRRAESESFERLAGELEDVYGAVLRKRRIRPVPAADPLADRPLVLADLHMHTEHSHDCSVPVPDLLDYAERIGLGAIAITDHNVFSGAQEAVELARDRALTVIPGEEVKTDAGEVIGLFLDEEIQRGCPGLTRSPRSGSRASSTSPTTGCTRSRTPTLHCTLAEIDVFEVYNARLLFEGFNDEALRFARKYNLTMGAGSDAHVLQGRHRPRAPARVRNRRGVPDQPPQRRDRAPAQVSPLPPGTSSGSRRLASGGARLRWGLTGEVCVGSRRRKARRARTQGARMPAGMGATEDGARRQLAAPSPG